MVVIVIAAGESGGHHKKVILSSKLKNYPPVFLLFFGNIFLFSSYFFWWKNPFFLFFWPTYVLGTLTEVVKRILVWIATSTLRCIENVMLRKMSFKLLQPIHILECLILSFLLLYEYNGFGTGSSFCKVLLTARDCMFLTSSGRMIPLTNREGEERFIKQL